MKNSSDIQEITQNLEVLSDEDLKILKKFVEFLSKGSLKPKSKSVTALLKHFNTIDEQDAEEIRNAIERECEKIDFNDWSRGKSLCNLVNKFIYII